MRRECWMVGFGLWMMVPAFLEAASYVPISDQALVQTAEVVVTGHVVAERFADCPSLRLPVCTVIELEVDEVLVGDAEASVVEVLLPGGRFEHEGRLAEVVSSLSPVLWPGDEVLLFLRRDAEGLLRLSSGALSAFVGIETTDGRRLGLRQMGDEDDVPGAAGMVRDFDRFAAAIAEGRVGDGSYWIPAVEGFPRKLYRKNASDCPELPVLLSQRWFLRGEVPGFSVAEMGSLIQEALDAWNREMVQGHLQFIGQTDAPRAEAFDGISVVLEDKEGLLPPFVGSGVVASAVGVSICRPDRGYREITDGFVLFAEGAGPWMAEPARRDLQIAEEILTHEFGHTLGLPHSCGDASSPACDSPYLDEATMRASVHTDGRGATLNDWDQDQIQAVFLNNPEPCVADAETLCLNNGRFRLTVQWRDFESRTGSGRARSFPDVDDSGLFWFFASDNLELLVKVLDACTFNDRFWVFAAATTNVEYLLRVEDTFTGLVRTYENPLGVRSPAVTDTEALATCPDASF